MELKAKTKTKQDKKPLKKQLCKNVNTKYNEDDSQTS